MYKVLLANLTFDKYESRVSPKGYHQKHDIDYYEIFSPMVKPQTIRVVLNIIVSMSYDTG